MTTHTTRDVSLRHTPKLGTVGIDPEGGGNRHSIYEIGEMHLVDLLAFFNSIKPAAKQRAVADTILKEVQNAAGTADCDRTGLHSGLNPPILGDGRLAGGESQRILHKRRRSRSGLMGMLYVLDEPSIGLHPKDNIKMIETLKRLRDLGNTVIVVEHDADNDSRADHIIETITTCIFLTNPPRDFISPTSTGFCRV